MPLAGAVATRLGCKRFLICTVSMFSLSLSLPFAGSLRLQAILLALLGFGIGATDCVMNIQAILVEKRADRNLMSGFHGFYSLGGIFSAGLMVVLLIAGVAVEHACGLVSLLLLGELCYAQRGLLPFASPKEGPAFALPHGTVLWIELICFALFLAEGTVLDWSDVYLTEHQHAAHSLASLGLFSFSLTMTLARPTGDFTVAHFGSRLVLTAGGVIAFASTSVCHLHFNWLQA